MARRFAGSRARFISQGRKTFWLAGVYVETTLSAASTAAIQSSLNAAALAFRPFTIVRSRGFFHVRSDQISASEDQSVAYGNIVVSDQSVAIGVTAVPTPVTDDQSSWHVFESMASRFSFVSGVGFDSQGGVLTRFDSKAMRKVEEGQDLIEVVETTGVSDGATVITYSRVLIKLH